MSFSVRKKVSTSGNLHLKVRRNISNIPLDINDVIKKINASARAHKKNHRAPSCGNILPQ